MDIETSISTTQEQLPQIRRIAKLEEVQRVIPPKPALPPEKKIKPPERPKYFIRFFILGLLFFGILGFELAVIYRYDRLNKRLYQVSVSLKDRLANLQHNLQYTNKVKDRLLNSRKGLVRNYLELGGEFKILQFKMDNYKGISKNISLSKSSKINLLEGGLRVAYARIEAMKAQNEVFAKELNDKGDYIRELTTKLINSIGEQELLLNENLRLKEECERLSEEILTLRARGETLPSEGKDVN